MVRLRVVNTQEGDTFEGAFPPQPLSKGRTVWLYAALCESEPYVDCAERMGDRVGFTHGAVARELEKLRFETFLREFKSSKDGDIMLFFCGRSRTNEDTARKLALGCGLQVTTMTLGYDYHQWRNRRARLYMAHSVNNTETVLIISHRTLTALNDKIQERRWVGVGTDTGCLLLTGGENMPSPRPDPGPAGRVGCVSSILLSMLLSPPLSDSVPGCPLIPEDEIVQVAVHTKIGIFGIEGKAEAADPSKTVRLLHWEAAEMLIRELLYDFYAGAVIDGTPGTGQAAMAAMNLSIVYYAFPRNDAHQHVIRGTVQAYGVSKLQDPEHCWYVADHHKFLWSLDGAAPKIRDSTSFVLASPKRPTGVRLRKAVATKVQGGLSVDTGERAPTEAASVASSPASGDGLDEDGENEDLSADPPAKRARGAGA